MRKGERRKRKTGVGRKKAQMKTAGAAENHATEFNFRATECDGGLNISERSEIFQPIPFPDRNESIANQLISIADRNIPSEDQLVPIQKRNELFLDRDEWIQKQLISICARDQSKKYQLIPWRLKDESIAERNESIRDRLISCSQWVVSYRLGDVPSGLPSIAKGLRPKAQGCETGGSLPITSSYRPASSAM